MKINNLSHCDFVIMTNVLGEVMGGYTIKKEEFETVVGATRELTRSLYNRISKCCHDDSSNKLNINAVEQVMLINSFKAVLEEFVDEEFHPLLAGEKSDVVDLLSKIEHAK